MGLGEVDWGSKEPSVDAARCLAAKASKFIATPETLPPTHRGRGHAAPLGPAEATISRGSKRRARA
jgi:hypothetical protein